MPSFLRRLSTFAGINHASPQLSKNDIDTPSPHHRQQFYTKSSKFRDEAVEESSKRHNATNNAFSDKAAPQPSNSASPTVSSTSSLSLSLPGSPSSISSYGPSRQQSTEALGDDDQPKPQPVLVPEQTVEDGASRSPSSTLPQPRSRSMPMLQDLQPGMVPKEYQMLYNQSMGIQPAPTYPTPSANRRHSADQLDNRPISCMSTTDLPPANAPARTQGTEGKKPRTRSFSNFLKFKFEGRDSPGRLPSGPKSSRWANRGGIGSKNEMMVDLETAGIFVPAHGQRLRSDFVYRAIVQCVDEVRRRGLDHQNIFYNLSPKKVISAMISLMMDQERCDLYTIRCLRIDTVASLMLNILSQMSNPVIPYAVMEYYFKQGISITRASYYSTSSSRRHSMHPGMYSDGSLLSMYASLPAIPALPSLDHPGSKSTSQETLSWAREYFDLQSFLDVLPSTNRVILLEVLHLCKDILDHQIENRLTFGRLVHQVAPALFSTVFDQRSVETMVGESRRCSIHGDSISAMDGRRAENHLFSIILIRFMFLTSGSSATMSRASAQEAGNRANARQRRHSHHRHSIAATSMTGFGRGGGGHARNESVMFRMSQERIQEEQQAYYRRMSRSYHEMEIQQCPQQHFGQYTTNQRQAQTKARRQSSYHSALYN